MMYSNPRRLIFLVIGALLVVALSACQPVVTTPASPAEQISSPTALSLSSEQVLGIQKNCSEASERGRAAQDSLAEDADLKYPPFKDLIYVQDQVIISGAPGDVDQALELLSWRLKPVEGVDLKGERPVQLFALGEENKGRVEDIVCQINEARRANEQLLVYADPNFFLSPAPWQGGGSPWTQNGEWSNQTPGGGLGEADDGDFPAQWAFHDRGVKLLDDSNERLVKAMGEGQHIAVFDTSPFSAEKLGGDRCDNCFPFEELGGKAMAETTGSGPALSVWRLQPQSSGTCPGIDRRTGESLEGQDISSHGLFVASLAHAVAPQSQITLIRVLENDGCGDLFTIISGLDLFMQEMLKQRGTLEGTVINLSLGVHLPPNPEDFALPPVVQSLSDKVQELIDAGAVVVAAAGNDSYDDPWDQPEAAEIPAGSPAGVIAVAASNIKAVRSCFSNAGEVAAPGGEGITNDSGEECRVPGPVVTPVTSEKAADRNYRCQNEAEYCIIGLGYNPVEANHAYIYWAGTSFATPLVSGQAALLLETLPPDQVADAIIDAATDGVISLP